MDKQQEKTEQWKKDNKNLRKFCTEIGCLGNPVFEDKCIMHRKVQKEKIKQG